MKDALVIFIYRSGNKQIICKYRLVSVLIILCKLFERGYKNRLLTFLETNNILNWNQCGFRWGFLMMPHWENSQLQLLVLRNGRNCVLQFSLILSKALDCIGHSIQHKPKKYGIGSEAFKWIESYLANSSQKGKISGLIYLWPWYQCEYHKDRSWYQCCCHCTSVTSSISARRSLCPLSYSWTILLVSSAAQISLLSLCQLHEGQW